MNPCDYFSLFDLVLQRSLKLQLFCSQSRTSGCFIETAEGFSVHFNTKLTPFLASGGKQVWRLSLFCFDVIALAFPLFSSKSRNCWQAQQTLSSPAMWRCFHVCSIWTPFQWLLCSSKTHETMPVLSYFTSLCFSLRVGNSSTDDMTCTRQNMISFCQFWVLNELLQHIWSPLHSAHPLNYLFSLWQPA